jgi:hypothetical protein
MRDVSMSGASGHGEEPMADPCVNGRRTRRITARQSHLPKIRVRPLKVPVFAAENRELAPATYLTRDANFGSWIAPDCAPIIGRRRETISGRRVICRWEWSESNEQHPEKRNKRVSWLQSA